MLNISKLQKKGYLAKEMLRLGVSEDIQQALKQIEDDNLIKSEDDFYVSESYITPEKKAEKAILDEKDHEKEQNQKVSNELSERLGLLEKKLDLIADFMNKYKAMNDNNLKEVDSRLKGLQTTIQEVKEMPKPANVFVEKKEPEEELQGMLEVEQVESPDKINKISEFNAVDKPKDKWSSSDFSVEKIFNNSNGRLAGTFK
ncbi:MAG: hypothetical protein ABII01_02310 [Candidatus Woesearchaeota archaeon]